MDVQLSFKAALIAGSVILAVASYYFGPFKGKANNPIEKVAEEVIKEETGISIELPENHDNVPNS